MSIEELQSTLIVHEQKFKRLEKEDEQARKVDYCDSSINRGCGRGRSSPRGRGRSFFNKETIECYKCHKLGIIHMNAQMRKKPTMLDLMKLKKSC
ncbi:hypothetical protein OSB04_006646 [Centaurea solstitialis]|uniref:Uncharacterized protein n=1 Tax=Centaurea solstitialis TaxID=347529 RepID=A0AA38WST4_9ASTR|nr:hypothetical protein OSB04_006646 [Centaurea solstitialis]